MRTALFIAGQAVGVLGGDEWSASVSRFVSRLALKSDAIDRSAGDAMVQRMRAIVGQNSYDTGALFNGITVTHGDGETVVEASAVRDGSITAGSSSSAERPGRRLRMTAISPAGWRPSPSSSAPPVRFWNSVAPISTRRSATSHARRS